MTFGTNYTALLTSLCKHYAARQNAENASINALAMPKPLLGKTYHVFLTMKRATNRGNLHDKYKLSYGLQACRRIESDESSAQRRRRRIWDVVSVVSGSGGFIEEDSSRATFKLTPEQLAEAFHIKVRKADWYTRVETVEKQLNIAFLEGRRDFNFPDASNKYFTYEWHYAYGLGSKLTETFKTGLKHPPQDQSNINRNIVIWGEWMAVGLPLATIFKKVLRKEFLRGNFELQSKSLRRHLEDTSKDIESAEWVKRQLQNIADRIKNKLKKLYNEDKITIWKDERHWKILFSILFHQINFHNQCTAALTAKQLDRNDYIVTMLQTLFDVIVLLLDAWNTHMASIKNLDDSRYARQHYHYKEASRLAASLQKKV